MCSERQALPSWGGVDCGKLRTACLWMLLAAVSAGGTACGPSKEQIRFTKATTQMRCEIDPDFAGDISLLDVARQDPKNLNDSVVYAMCETGTAMLAGHRELAGQVAKEAHAAVQKYQNVDKEKSAAAGNEAVKFFKGEPHERALLAFYAGLACYTRGEYNEARIFFRQALLATETRDDDMADFREDFQLGHYWLGRAFMKLEDDDNARVAFHKAGVKLSHPGEEAEVKKYTASRRNVCNEERKAEAVCYKQFSAGKQAVEGLVDLSAASSRSQLPAASPEAGPVDPTQLRAETLEAFLDPGFQEQVNLILIVEMGWGPIKYLTGSHGTYDEYLQVGYREHGADVFIDGYRSGPTFRLLDVNHQAVTRGVKTRRSRQTGKAVTKEILTHIPYIGDVASYWDIQGDARYWMSLPGEVHVYAAQVSPGLHTVSLKFFDFNDEYLPRYDVTRHYIPVPGEGEIVLLLHSVENQDNGYLLTHVATP